MTEQEFNETKQKAESGDVEAMFKLAYEYGGENEHKDFSLAFKWYKQAAELGHVVAMSNLGNWAYVCGNGVEKNLGEGMKWLLKAAEAGNVWSMNKIAHLYGNEPEVKNLSMAAKWYEHSAHLGNLNSIENLGGFCYLHGNGLEKNVYLALEWLKVAIDKGANDDWTKDRYEQALRAVGDYDREHTISMLTNYLTKEDSVSSSQLLGDVSIMSKDATIKSQKDYTIYKFLNEDIPTDIEHYEIPEGVTEIPIKKFFGCKNLRSITIPNSVTSIGDSAFCECSSLTSVTIPNSVTSIGDGAFCECSSLTSVTIPNSVTSIGGAAFGKCSSLTSVTIPNSVTSIGLAAFAKCSSLTSVTIPNSVMSIGKYAFAQCTALSSITIPNSVTSIGEEAFMECSSLTSITIPNSVTSIGEMAFFAVANIVYAGNATGATWGAKSVNGFVDGYLIYSDASKTTLRGCSSVAKDSITIPDSVTSIGEKAFHGCFSLTSVTIPNSVTSIGKGAFYGVANIVYAGNATGATWGAKSVNGFVDGYLIYSDASKTTLCGCSSVAKDSIIIPNSVTRISNYAFLNCFSLTSVTIPNSVTSIGDGAFTFCTSLTSVTIPNSVTSIGEGAFEDNVKIIRS